MLRRLREDWAGLDRGTRWFEVILLVTVGAITFAEALIPAMADIDAVMPLAVRGPLGVATAMLAMVGRRTYPITALMLITVIGSFTGGGILATVITVFGVGYRTARASLTALAVVASAVVSGLIAVSVNREPGLPLLPTLLLTAFMNAIPAVVGRYRRGRSALISAGWERAHHLEREQAIIAEQARLRERARIAQDMHDSLGHDLSLIALQAGSLEVADDLPQRHRETAQLLRSTTTVAMSRLRSIIGILREEGDSEESYAADGSEDVAGIPQLIERSIASGADVTLDQPGDIEPLPSSSDRAIYRVVQESLTNVTKHAPGARTVVSLRSDDGRVLVEITNAAPAADDDREGTSDDDGPTTISGGRGLVGIAERVRLAGGRLDAGPHDGGFRVAAYLPSESESSAPAELAAGADEPTPETRSAESPSSGTVAGLPAYPGGERPVGSGAGRRTMSRLRSDFWLRLVLPGFGLFLASVVVIIAIGVQISTAPKAVYERLRIGQSQAEVEEELPPPRIVNERAMRARPTPPENAECELYLPGRRNIYLADWDRLYRLCYVDGRLISKDIIGP